MFVSINRLRHIRTEDTSGAVMEEYLSDNYVINK